MRRIVVTYTALGGSALLLDVKVPELATRSLDHTDILAAGVVRGPSALPTVSLEFQTTKQFQFRGFLAASWCGQTYVGKSSGRHFDGIPEDSDGGVTAVRVSDVRYAKKYTYASDGENDRT